MDYPIDYIILVICTIMGFILGGLFIEHSTNSGTTVIIQKKKKSGVKHEM